MDKLYTFAEVKAVSDEGTGEFEAILSAPTLDRDGEIIDPGAFEPLPKSIPVHVDHRFETEAVVGRAEPFYDGDMLKVRGKFTNTARGQEVRTLVADGFVDSMSVGFMAAERDSKDGATHVTRAELIEASFVSIPANRDALVLSAKEYDEKVGRRNSERDLQNLQAIHDTTVQLGAACDGKSYSAAGGTTTVNNITVTNPSGQDAEESIQRDMKQVVDEGEPHTADTDQEDVETSDPDDGSESKSEADPEQTGASPDDKSGDAPVDAPADADDDNEIRARVAALTAEAYSA